MDRWRSGLYALGVAGAFILVVLTWPGDRWPNAPSQAGAGSAVAQDEPPIFIYVDKHNRIFMSDPADSGWVVVGKHDIAAHLKRLQSVSNPRHVTLTVDEAVDTTLTVEVMDNARKSGAPTLSLTTGPMPDEVLGGIQ